LWGLQKVEETSGAVSGLIVFRRLTEAKQSAAVVLHERLSYRGMFRRNIFRIFGIDNGRELFRLSHVWPRLGLQKIEDLSE
jgi:hypothetical protein